MYIKHVLLFSIFSSFALQAGDINIFNGQEARELGLPKLEGQSKTILHEIDSPKNFALLEDYPDCMPIIFLKS